MLLYHGRVDRRKGALDMLDALDLLRAEGLAPPFIVSGIGPDHDEVARRVALTGGQGRMRGYVAYEDVPAVYHEADVFVSPTYAEGFSNTVLEAMSSGLLCVSCRAVGVMDCLRDGENGLLTEPGDVPALAVALRRAVTDAALRRRLAASGLEECRRLYSWPAVARQIAGVYEAVLGGGAPAGFPEALAVEPCRFRAEPHLL